MTPRDMRINAVNPASRSAFPTNVLSIIMYYTVSNIDLFEYSSNHKILGNILHDCCIKYDRGDKKKREKNGLSDHHCRVTKKHHFFNGFGINQSEVWSKFNDVIIQ